jgi:hypothetical protein
MAFSNDTRSFLQIIAQECVDVASRASVHIIKDVQKTTLLMNILNVDLRAENPNQCMDCMSLFLDESIVSNPNTKEHLPMSTYIRTGPCGALCSTSINDLIQEASMIVDTVTDIPFTVSPGNRLEIVNNIYEKMQNKGVSYFRKVTKDQIDVIVGGLDWTAPMNEISASSASSIFNVVNTEGTSISVSHVAQTSVVDAVFTQIFNTQLAVVQTTLVDAVREESRLIETFIDDTFAAQFGSAVQTNQYEFTAVGGLALLLLISWAVILLTRRRFR